MEPSLSSCPLKASSCLARKITVWIRHFKIYLFSDTLALCEFISCFLCSLTAMSILLLPNVFRPISECIWASDDSCRSKDLFKFLISENPVVTHTDEEFLLNSKHGKQNNLRVSEHPQSHFFFWYHSLLNERVVGSRASR